MWSPSHRRFFLAHFVSFRHVPPRKYTDPEYLSWMSKQTRARRNLKRFLRFSLPSRVSRATAVFIVSVYLPFGSVFSAQNTKSPQSSVAAIRCMAWAFGNFTMLSAKTALSSLTPDKTHIHTHTRIPARSHKVWHFLGFDEFFILRCAGAAFISRLYASFLLLNVSLEHTHTHTGRRDTSVEGKIERTRPELAGGRWSIGKYACLCMCSDVEWVKLSEESLNEANQYAIYFNCRMAFTVEPKPKRAESNQVNWMKCVAHFSWARGKRRQMGRFWKAALIRKPFNLQCHPNLTSPNAFFAQTSNAQIRIDKLFQ